MKTLLLFILLLASGAIAGSAVDNPPTAPTAADYTLTEIASGFDNALFVTNAGDGSGRLFVGEQTGFILIILPDGDVLFDPFLDISEMLSNDVSQGGYTERGLLGMAFHPQYRENGRVFISHTDAVGDSILAEYRVDSSDPNRLDPNSRREVLRIAQPYYDHNAGHIAFAPDGTLFMSIGDGGSLGDAPGITSQDTMTLLGKLLRIDVDGGSPYAIPADNPFVGRDDALPEIFAYGLRNPWRFSFDRVTGDLYIGDVGQMDYEEVNFLPADHAGGANFGWWFYEASRPYRDDAPPPDSLTMPIAEYPHLIGCSVTGGYVYRGAALSGMVGIYVFGDYCTGRTWSLLRDTGDRWRVQPFLDTGMQISSFGEDENGELLIVDYKGTIARLDRAN